MYDVISTDGTKIAVEDINPPSSKVIVMVHGWPISKKMFEYQKDVLSDMGYRLVSFDIRGFGDSQVTGTGYNYDQLADDLYTVINHLNVPTVTLIGFSMGGAISVRYMAKYNNHKVSKLILMGAAAPSFTRTVNNPYGKTIQDVNQLIQSTYQDRPLMVNNFGDQVFAVAHSDAFKTWFRGLCYKASGIGTIKTAISLRDEDVFNDLSHINVPTFIMHGKLDQVCPFGFALIMNQQIPDSRLFPFERSGHGLFYDELDLFNRTLISILMS